MLLLHKNILKNIAKQITLFTIALTLIVPFVLSAPIADSRTLFQNYSNTSISQKTKYVRILTNQLARASKKYKNDHLLENIAKKRSSLLLEIAKEDPDAFISLIKKNLKSKKIKKLSSLPLNALYYIERKVVVESELDVLHIDDFDNPLNSKVIYTLNDGSEELEFYPLNDVNISHGEKIKIKGIRIGDTILANTSIAGSFALLASPSPKPSVGEQKMLVVLTNYLNSGEPPFTPDEVKDLIFDSPFQNYYQEQSYGKTFFTGDVTDWITINGNITEAKYASPSHASFNKVEIENYIISNSIDLANYNRVLFVVHHELITGGMSAGGMRNHLINGTTYKFSRSWVSLHNDYDQPSIWGAMPFEWSTIDYLLSHELGHALGAQHSRSWDCWTEPVPLRGESCTSWNYGNVFDVMGTGKYALHFNAFLKAKLGWLDPQDILEVKEPGTYIVNPLELSSSETKLAKIFMEDGSHAPFYLEHRRGLGFDQKLNNTHLKSNQAGLLITYHENPNDRFSYLLDMRPTPDISLRDITEASLNAGVFVDDLTGISIYNIKDLGEEGISFSVSYEDVRPIRAISWQSLATHSDIGTIALEIPDENTDINDPTLVFTETRSSGAKNLLITFDDAINPDNVHPLESVKVFNANTFGEKELVYAPYTTSIAEKTLNIVFDSSLENSKKYLITIDLVGDIFIEGDNDRALVALEGDVDKTWRVSLNDMLHIRSWFGVSVNKDTAHLDVDLNGQIDIDDILTVRSQFGESL